MNKHTLTPKPSGRVDRRITRTRRQLQEALTALILEKGYDAVTIEEITNRADLGRTTFYLHYRDKEDLLLESIEKTAQELYQQVYVDGPPEISRAAQDGLPAIDRVFTHAAANSTLYRIILKGGAASSVRRTILDFLSEATLPILKRAFGQQATIPIPLDAVTGFFSASLLGFLTWWLEDEMPYPPEMASRYFTQLFLFGARSLEQNAPGPAATS